MNKEKIINIFSYSLNLVHEIFNRSFFFMFVVYGLFVHLNTYGVFEVNVIDFESASLIFTYLSFASGVWSVYFFDNIKECD